MELARLLPHKVAPRVTSPLQARAAGMIEAHGFVGVPLETYDAAGREQFVRLLQSGLVPGSKVLDIGCGTLRLGWWLIPFLDRGNYFGIEPARDRVDLGLRYIVRRRDRWGKRPSFDHNASFDISVFRTSFDFLVAGSIWTHCSKRHVETMLDGFVRNATPAGTFLATHLPPRTPDEEYLGDTWVGTSHESTSPGVICHSLSWIQERCAQRGLTVEQLDGAAFDDQLWLRVRRAEAQR
jgi:cyclopropane fatty-acyl-phospholipid synthase-like methyltransferase